MRKNKTVFQRPNFDLAKSDSEKSQKFFENFSAATQRQVQRDIKKFSTLSMLKNQFSKKKEDQSDAIILETIKRMEKDKLQSNIAMYIAERCQNQAQNIQKTSLIKMVPFLVALLGMIISISMMFTVKPLEFSNPSLILYLSLFALFLPLFIWGSRKRKEAKVEMLSINILLQAASAFASAKMQGKGSISAMQNLSEMRNKSKKIAEKNKKAKKK